MFGDDMFGDALDELDDLFQDENLFQDLEDLGEVLDELTQEMESQDGESSAGVSSSELSKR